MSREIMQQALDALKYHTEHTYPFHLTNVAIEALQKALAQPKQEAVAWQNLELPMEFYEYEHLDPMWHHHYRPLYTAPPSKEWVGLTDEEMIEIWKQHGSYETLFKKVEIKLKDKNT
jgi:hypothetical protein